MADGPLRPRLSRGATGTVTYGGFSLHLGAEGEVDRPLRELQVMVATVASLLALFSITAFVGFNYDDLQKGAERLREAHQPVLASVCFYVPTWCTGLSGSFSLLAVTTSLGLFASLCAANVNGHVRKHELLLQWVRSHYVLLCLEMTAMLLSIVFLWIGCLVIGIVKSGVQPRVFGGVGVAATSVFFSSWGRIIYLHITRTLPSIREAQEDDDKDEELAAKGAARDA